MSDCIFCKIRDGEVPSDTLYQDDDVLIFRDIHPQAPTHLLVIPKKHIDSVITMDESDNDVPGMLILKAKRFAEEHDIPGYNLSIACGKEGGQEVFHIHLHLKAQKKI